MPDPGEGGGTGGPVEYAGEEEYQREMRRINRAPSCPRCGETLWLFPDGWWGHPYADTCTYEHRA